MIRPLLVVLACVGTLPAETRDAYQTRRTFESLQGDWGVRSMTVAGNPADPASLRDMRYTFEGDRLVRSNQPEESARLNIDVTGRVPKVEFTDRHGVTMTGLIQRTGDTVKMCVAEAGDRPPPAAFESTADNKAVLVEMTPDRR